MHKLLLLKLKNHNAVLKPTCMSGNPITVRSAVSSYTADACGEDLRSKELIHIVAQESSQPLGAVNVTVPEHDCTEHLVLMHINCPPTCARKAACSQSNFGSTRP